MRVPIEDPGDLPEETLQRLELAGTRSVTVLSGFDEGDVVSVDDVDDVGLIIEVMTETFEMPVEEDEDEEPIFEDIEASDENPVYVVAVEDGMIAVDASHLTPDSFDDGGKGDDEEDVKELVRDAEEASVYSYIDDPCNCTQEDFELAMTQCLLDHHMDALAEHGLSETDVEEMSYEELVRTPGIRTRATRVGFKTLPPGWNRKSVLKAWKTLGGKWRTCVPRMRKNIGLPRRWCAVLKDEVYKTTYWRNRW